MKKKKTQITSEWAFTIFLLTVLCVAFIASSFSAAENMKRPVPPAISKAEYNSLINVRSHLEYKDPGNNYHSVAFGDCKISVKNFLLMFNNVSGSDDTWGMRIYAGLSTGNDSLLYIIAVADSSEGSSSDQRYYLIKKATYTSTALPETLTVTQAKTYIKNYTDHVTVFHHTQSGDVDTFKLSRYYDWTEFTHLFSDNIVHFNPADESTYSGYSIVIRAGYITADASDYFWNEYGDVFSGQQSNSLTGTTSLFYLKDPSNQNMIDPNKSGSNLDYQGLIMEIGRPCPPECGTITWSNL